MNFDQRPLAEALVDQPSQYAAHRVAHGIVIAPWAGWQIVEDALGRIAQKG